MNFIFCNLPPEIFAEILSFFDYTDVILAQHICKDFYKNIHQSINLKKLGKKMKEQIESQITISKTCFPLPQNKSYTAISAISNSNIKQYESLLSLGYQVNKDMHWLPAFLFPPTLLQDEFEIEKQATFIKTKIIDEQEIPPSCVQFLEILCYTGNIGLFNYLFYRLNKFFFSNSVRKGNNLIDIRNKLRDNDRFAKAAIYRGNILMMEYLKEHLFSLSLSGMAEYALEVPNQWRYFLCLRLDFSMMGYNHIVNQVACQALKKKNYFAYEYIQTRLRTKVQHTKNYLFIAAESGNLNVIAPINEISFYVLAGLAKGGHIDLLVLFYLLRSIHKHKNFHLIDKKEWFIECSTHPDFVIKVFIQQQFIDNNNYQIHFEFIPKKRYVSNSSISVSRYDSSKETIDDNKKRKNAESYSLTNEKKWKKMDGSENVKEENENESIFYDFPNKTIFMNIHFDTPKEGEEEESEEQIDRFILENACEGGHLKLVKILIKCFRFRSEKILENASISGSVELFQYLQLKMNSYNKKQFMHKIFNSDTHISSSFHNLNPLYREDLGDATFDLLSLLFQSNGKNDSIKILNKLPHRSIHSIDESKTNLLTTNRFPINILSIDSFSIISSLRQLLSADELIIYQECMCISIARKNMELFYYLKNFVQLNTEQFKWALKVSNFAAIPFFKQEKIPLCESMVDYALSDENHAILFWLIIEMNCPISKEAREKIASNPLYYPFQKYIKKYYSC